MISATGISHGTHLDGVARTQERCLACGCRQPRPPQPHQREGLQGDARQQRHPLPHLHKCEGQGPLTCLLFISVRAHNCCFSLETLIFRF